MPIIVFMALMIALLLFIIWDRKQSAKVVTRDQISKGFVPKSMAKWPGFLGLALVSFFTALNKIITPSVPPFTGKGSTMNTLAYQALGDRGPAFLWVGIGAILVVAAYVSYRSGPQR